MKAGLAVVLVAAAAVGLASCGNRGESQEKAERGTRDEIAEETGLQNTQETLAAPQVVSPADRQTVSSTAQKVSRAVVPQPTTIQPKPPSAAALPPTSIPADALVVEARLVEIPGTFPPNDLYNYVYVMKYRVLRVLQGSYGRDEILVGHYNPLVPRPKITGKMKDKVAGDVQRFAEGDVHRLVLVKPLQKMWSDAVEDEYFDEEADKYFAVGAYAAK